MRKFFKYQNGEITIIWNEKPMINNYEYNQYYTEIRNKTITISSSFLVGMELKVHRGGRICYGLLTAQVKPHNECDCIKVSITYTQENSVKYGESGLLNNAFAYKGLPKEYVLEISKSIKTTIMTKESYPQCEIAINYAANCEVGSNPMIFGIIAETLIKLICNSSAEKIQNMDIKTFAEEYIRKINLQY